MKINCFDEENEGSRMSEGDSNWIEGSLDWIEFSRHLVSFSEGCLCIGGKMLEDNT